MQISDQQRVIIVDPDYNIAEKIRRKFSACIPNFKPNRVLHLTGDCAKLVPSFLEGSLIRKVESLNHTEEQVKHDQKSPIREVDPNLFVTGKK